MASSAEAEKQKAIDDAKVAQEHADAALKAQEAANKLQDEALQAQKVLVRTTGKVAGSRRVRDLAVVWCV